MNPSPKVDIFTLMYVLSSLAFFIILHQVSNFRNFQKCYSFKCFFIESLMFSIIILFRLNYFLTFKLPKCTHFSFFCCFQMFRITHTLTKSRNLHLQSKTTKTLDSSSNRRYEAGCPPNFQTEVGFLMFLLSSHFLIESNIEEGL